jgi:uncharacterized protein (DUF1810 family)
MSSDPWTLARFVVAQEPVIARVRAELAAGEKRSHWMWFIFPQLQGLGSSATAQRYAIASLGEARAYLAHAVLGARLIECTRLVTGVEGRSIGEIFGYPDDLKFRSCMTLFAYAAGERALPGAETTGPGVFSQALDRYFAGEEDPLTVKLLTSAS